MEGFLHETTIATVVPCAERAINKLLLRKFLQIMTVEGVETFLGANCAEGPTGTASALVLDGCDDPLFSPIDRFWESVISVCKSSIIFISIFAVYLGEFMFDVYFVETQIVEIELFVSYIGEVVETLSELWVGSLIRGYFQPVFVESFETVDLFGYAGVCFSLLLLPEIKGTLDDIGNKGSLMVDYLLLSLRDLGFLLFLEFSVGWVFGTG